MTSPEEISAEAIKSVKWPSRHRFSDSVNIEEEINQIISQTSEKELIEGTAKYLQNDLQKTYDSDYSTKNKNISAKNIEQKAEDIILGTNQASNILPNLQKRNARKKAICRAVNRGYIKDFKLDTPWHPFPLLTGKLMTFPFQHKEALMYHGTFQSIFFKRGEKPKEAGISARGGDWKEETSWKLCNPTSIITQGAYWKRNIYGSQLRNGWDARYGDKPTSSTKGIFLWASPGKVGEITLELKLPTKNLGHTRDGISTTSEMFDKYGSPEEWRDQLVNAHKGKDPSKSVEFVYTAELPLERITGVMVEQEQTRLGKNLSLKDAEFIPLDQYIERLRQDHQSEKIPNSEEISKLKRKAEHEYRRIQEIQDILKAGQIHKIATKISESILAIISLRTNKNPKRNRSFPHTRNWLNRLIEKDQATSPDKKELNRHYENLIEDLNQYNRRVDKLFKYLSEDPNSLWINNIDNLEEWHNTVLGEKGFLKAEKDVNRLLKNQHELLKQENISEEEELLDLEQEVFNEIKNTLPKINLTNEFKTKLKNSDPSIF